MRMATSQAPQPLPRNRAHRRYLSACRIDLAWAFAWQRETSDKAETQAEAQAKRTEAQA
jgi:hypothetical protein